MLDNLLSPLGRPSTTRWLTSLEIGLLQIPAVGRPNAQAAHLATPHSVQSEHDKPLATRLNLTCLSVSLTSLALSVSSMSLPLECAMVRVRLCLYPPPTDALCLYQLVLPLPLGLSK